MTVQVIPMYTLRFRSCVGQEPTVDRVLGHRIKDDVEARAWANEFQSAFPDECVALYKGGVAMAAA
jgi:hypothetical protein